MRKTNLIIIGIVIIVAIGVFLGLQRTAESTEPATISGSFLFRERIMPPPDAVARVTLEDVSLADAASKTVTSEVFTLDGKAPPYDFMLTVEDIVLDPRGRYAVRAEIRDGADKLLWTTDTAHVIDPAATDQTLDPITLVMVNASP